MSGRSGRRAGGGGGGGIASGAVAGALAVLVGTLTVWQPGAAAVVAAGLLVPGALWLISRTSPQADLAGKSFRWVGFAWVFLLLRPIGDYSQGRSALAAAAGHASAANVVEVLAHAAIALLAIVSMRRNGLGRWPPWPVLALPSLALLSAAWSPDPLITLAFSFELFVIVLLVTLTTAIFHANPAVGRTIISDVLRLSVQLVALLSISGLLFGDAGLGPLSTGQRFTWPGAHPIVASVEIGFAFLVLIFAWREARFSVPTTVGLLGLFSFCLYHGQTRTALTGLAISALLGYWIASRRRAPVPRLAGGLLIAAVVILVVTRFGAAIDTYLYRGESQQQVSSFNGRSSLWELGLQGIQSPQHWLGGYGLGSTRVLFSTSVRWAGEAHSAWLELLLSLGLVGLAAGIALVIAVGIRLFRGRLDSPVLPVLFIYLLAMSPVGSGFGLPGPGPGLGFGLLALCYAACPLPRRAEEQQETGQAVRLRGEIRPAPT